MLLLPIIHMRIIPWQTLIMMVCCGKIYKKNMAIKMNEKHFAQGWVSTFFCHLYNVVQSYNLNPYLQKPNVFSNILSLNCHVMSYIFRCHIKDLFHLIIHIGIVNTDFSFTILNKELRHVNKI